MLGKVRIVFKTIYVCAESQDDVVEGVTYLLNELGPLSNRGISVSNAAALQGALPHDALALVALIDAEWLNAEKTARQGDLMAAPSDSLHRLLAWAGRSGVRVFTVLLDSASMPSRAELPSDIAYLASLQAFTLRTHPDTAAREDALNLVRQVAIQLGFMQARLTLTWVGLLLLASAMMDVFLLVLFPHAWPLYIASGALAIGLSVVMARIVYSPMGFYLPSYTLLLLPGVALSLGGAYLFAVNALSDSPRSDSSFPLAALGAFLFCLGLVAYWVVSLFLIVGLHSGRTLMLPWSPNRAQTEAHNYFLSYRRADSLAVCDRIETHLSDHSEVVFRDINAILLGADFETVLERAVSGSEVMLVLIGPQWLTLQDAEGRRRIDDPADYVHRELALALAQHKRILLLAVNGGRIPSSAQLPQDLADVTKGATFTIRDDPYFDADMRAVTRHVFNEERNRLRRLRIALITFGAVGALLFPIPIILVPHLPLTSWWSPSLAQLFTSAVGVVFRSVTGVALMVGIVVGCVEAIAKRRWGWIVSILMWAVSFVGAYYLVTAQPALIPSRFTFALQIAAGIALLGLAVDLYFLTIDARYLVVTNRAQAGRDHPNVYGRST